MEMDILLTRRLADLENKSVYKIIAHYLDDSLFGGEKDSDECEKMDVPL